MWLMIALVVNCCCVGGVVHSKRGQLLCGLMHAAVPIGVLLYIWFGTPQMLTHFLQGKMTWGWCMALCIWALIQITCGLFLVCMMVLGFSVRAMVGKEEDKDEK